MPRPPVAQALGSAEAVSARFTGVKGRVKRPQGELLGRRIFGLHWWLGKPLSPARDPRLHALGRFWSPPRLWLGLHRRHFYIFVVLNFLADTMRGSVRVATVSRECSVCCPLHDTVNCRARAHGKSSNRFGWFFYGTSIIAAAASKCGMLVDRLVAPGEIVASVRFWHRLSAISKAASR